jgi:transposase IS66 family protein
MVDRVSEAIVPQYTAIGEVACTSLVNYIDESSWLMHGDRQWLWVMANPAVTSLQIHPNRSKAALVQLIGGWTGILVRDGYGVSQSWEGLWQSGLAHLIRTAKAWQSVWKRAWLAVAGGCMPSCNGCVLGNRAAHGGTPIRRLLSRGKTSPLHTLLHFLPRYVAWHLAADLPFRPHPCLQRL